MVKVNRIENAVEIIETLLKDLYSPLWWVVEDFEVNGHRVEIQGVNQIGHIVIDDHYVDAYHPWNIPDEANPGERITVTGLEYVEILLRKEVKKENV